VFRLFKTLLQRRFKVVFQIILVYSQADGHFRITTHKQDKIAPNERKGENNKIPIALSIVEINGESHTAIDKA